MYLSRHEQAPIFRGHVQAMDVEPPDELTAELLVLKAIPGVSLVGEFPKGRHDKKQNKNHVRCRVEVDGSFSPVDVHCTEDGRIPDKLTAAREVKRQVGLLLGLPAVEAAEAAVLKQFGPAAASFFERSRAAQQKVQQRAELKAQLKDASQLCKETMASLRAAEAAHDAAYEELGRIQDALSALSDEPDPKRQRAEDAAGSSQQAAEATEQQQPAETAQQGVGTLSCVRLMHRLAGVSGVKW